MNARLPTIPITAGTTSDSTARRASPAPDGIHHPGHPHGDHATSPSDASTATAATAGVGCPTPAPAPVDRLTAARAEALFTSDLPTGSRPNRPVASRAISAAVHRHGGTRGCAAAMAFAYGDTPETAAPRMRWARDVAHAVFDRRTAMQQGRPGRDVGAPTSRPGDDPATPVHDPAHRGGRGGRRWRPGRPATRLALRILAGPAAGLSAAGVGGARRCAR